MKCICPRVGWWDGRRVKKSELWGILIPRRPQPLIPVMRCVHCAILLNFSSHTAFISFKSLSLQVRQQYSLHLQELFEHCAIHKINLPIQSSKFPFPLSKKLASRILRSWVEKKIFDGVARCSYSQHCTNFPLSGSTPRKRGKSVNGAQNGKLRLGESVTVSHLTFFISGFSSFETHICHKNNSGSTHR